MYKKSFACVGTAGVTHLQCLYSETFSCQMSPTRDGWATIDLDVRQIVGTAGVPDLLFYPCLSNTGFVSKINQWIN